MMYVATLIADVPNDSLSRTLVERISGQMLPFYEDTNPYIHPAPSIACRKEEEVWDIFFSYEEENIRRLKYPWLENGPRYILQLCVLAIFAAGWWAKHQGVAFALRAETAYMIITFLAAGLIYFSTFWRKRLLNTPSLWRIVKEDGYGITPSQAHEIISAQLAGKSIDHVIRVAPAKASFKLLISDMDSTMIQQECIDELADFVGKKEHVAAITERAMNGELVFEDALRERVALLKGLSVDVLQECFDKKITAMGGAKELVAAFKKQGGKAVLVSGGFTFFTERVAKMLGFDEHYANILEVENGKLTGTVREPILGKEAKLAELHRQCTLLGIKPENVIAIGDGANDLPMLKAAGLGIAYHAKPTVQAQTNARINHGDLSAVISLL